MRVAAPRSLAAPLPIPNGLRTPRTAVDDLGQRPADHPHVLARPGPHHEHDIPLLVLQLRVDRAGLRVRAPVVQMAQVGPREQVTGFPELPAADRFTARRTFRRRPSGKRSRSRNGTHGAGLSRGRSRRAPAGGGPLSRPRVWVQRRGRTLYSQSERARSPKAPTEMRTIGPSSEAPASRKSAMRSSSTA